MKSNGLLKLIVLFLIFILSLVIALGIINDFIIKYLGLFIMIVSGIYIVILILNKDAGTKAKTKEKLFNSLLKNSDTIYIMIDNNNKIVFMSENTEEILGISNNSKSQSQIVSEILNTPVIKSELKNIDEDKQYVSQIFEYTNPMYQHPIWIKIKMFPYKERNNKYQIIQIVDATKEHDRQHLLISQTTDIKSREKQLNQITTYSYDMEINVNVISNSFDLKYFKLDNKYFGEERRGTYTENIKSIIDKYINKKDKELVYNNLSLDNLKDKFNKYELNPIIFRYRIGDEVKNNIWLESTIFFLSTRGNNKVSILTKNVTEDAESIRKQNYLLQSAVNDAKMADKAKNELISTISHDIRTPLTNIMGLSESLINLVSDKELKNDIKNIKKSSEEVLVIIDGLLDVSKIEKRTIERQEKPYSILKMFKIIEDNAKEYLNDKSVKLNINLNSNLPVILKGDYVRITQAITEIVNNSIKYTDDGEININVKGIKNDSLVNLIIEISDTGIGISKTKLSSILTSSDNKGIDSVKKLMELLDGKLEIESSEGEYTKVTLEFVQKIVEDNKIREKIENNKTAELFDLEGKNILIIDDNKLNLKVTSRLLEPFKIKSTLAENAIVALEMIKEENIYDLILVDQMMPEMDGTTFLNKVKEIKDFNSPVVVLTADAIKGSKEKYLKDGFDDYISKPIDKKELSRVLSKFLKSQK